MLPDTDRIATLRQRCLARKWHTWVDSPVVNAASLLASEAEPSWPLRRAMLCRDRLRGLFFEIDDCEPLAGRPAKFNHSPQQIDEAREYLSQYTWPGGQTGHCELDLSELFEVGVAGLRCRLEALRDKCDGDKKTTYQTFLLALNGLQEMIMGAGSSAAAAVADAEGARRAELLDIAESCQHISKHAPRTFQDAIQLLWLVVLASNADGAGLTSPGHLDRTLRPFYEADFAAGRITRERALVLIEALYLLVNEAIPDGLAMAVMVGGRDAEGNDLTCELSYLCLEAIRRTKLIYPTVGICWHEGTPEELVDLAVELVSQGCPTPAFFNDATIQKGLAALNVPPRQRCNYINSTCVEITPVGASNVWVASPYFNLCRMLLEEIAAQCGMGILPMCFTGVSPVSERDEGVPPSCPAGILPSSGMGVSPMCSTGVSPVSSSAGFDVFLATYYRRLEDAIAQAVAVENSSRRQRAQWGGKPLQSIFTRDCIARGADLDRGGAIYNWVECSFVGMANLADSLHVIREEVFGKKSLTLAQLKVAMDANYDGHEPLRLRLLNGHPKYGNGAAEVDELVARTARFFQDRCATHKMLPDDSPFVPGSFCWIMHEVLGRETGATPDGRKAGFPFADGGGPAQGRERHGPTAAILSTTSWDHSPMIGGLAYNMKFNTALLKTPADRARLRDLVLTYLRRGGFETQINVIDRDVLLEAQKDPERHRDLAVRIGGYVDYFTRLSPQMQAEVLMRTEFSEL